MKSLVPRGLRGEIRPSVLKGTRGKRGAFRFRRPWAMRWSGGPKPREPGDLVEVDTLSVTLSAGRVVKQFTAKDVVSGWNVLGYSPVRVPAAAGGFFGRCFQGFPFG